MPDNFSLIFPIPNVDAQLTDEGIKPEAIHIMEHRILLSRPDLLGGFSNLNSSIDI